MRKGLLGLLLILVAALPVVWSASAPQETVDFTAKVKDLAVTRYDERATLVLPDRPLSFEAEIPYQAAVDDKRSVDHPAYLRITIMAPGGVTYEEANLRPGDKKSGVIRLIPGHQVRVELYAGQYNFLFVKSGADARCSIKWPEFRLIAREQTRHYGFNMSAAGWAAADRWTWDFGDGTRGQGAEVDHLYRKAGTYRLQVMGYQGSTQIQSYQRNMVVPEFIEVNPDVKPLSGAVEHKIVCRSGLLSHYGEGAEAWWDFGDGSPAAVGDEVEYVYRRPGRYVVALTARHLGSSYTIRRTWNVDVRPLSIQNRAQLLPLEGTIPLKVLGTSQPAIDGSPVDLIYRWDFGDGNLADQPKTAHVFSEAGQYRVTLYLSDRLHPELNVQPMTFTVRALPPALSIAPTANPLRGQAPLTVLFVPGVRVQGYPTDLRYRWEFGDGTVSEQETPLHTFQNNGEYSVRLTVQDAIHRTEVRGGLRISVSGAPGPGSGLTVAAYVEPRYGRSPLTVNCRADVTSDPGAVGYLSYEWDFGNSAKAVGKTATYTYRNPGTYNLILTVRDTRPGRTEFAQVGTVVTVY